MHKLKQREKMTLLVGGTLFLVLVLVWFFFVWENSSWNKYQAARRTVQSRQELFEQMARLHRSYRRIQGEMERIRSEALLREEGAAIQGILERTAAEKMPSAELIRMGVRTADIEDIYRETRVVMELQGVTLEELVEFAYTIQTDGPNLRIRGLKVDLNRRDPDLLDVEFTVSAISDLS